MFRDVLAIRLFAFFLLLATWNCSHGWCPSNENCTCRGGSDDEDIVICEFGLDEDGDKPGFLVNILFDRTLLIQCSKGSRWSDLPKDLVNSSISNFHTQFCDLSENFTLVNLAKDLNVLQVKSLGFHSFRKQSDGLELTHLNEFLYLKELSLYSNGFTALPWEAFINLSGLTSLDLRNNSLSHLPAEAFGKMHDMATLYLGTNRLAAIDPRSFQNLANLTTLNISDNCLKTIESGTLDKQVLLKSLYLNRNLLEELPSDTFRKLSNVEILYLDGNNFSSLPQGLFTNNTSLKELYLYNNARNMSTFPNALFANLRQLDKLILNKNGLMLLPEDLFHNSTSLTNVNLNGNYLQILPVSIFQGLKWLSWLDLSENQLEILPEYIFRDLGELRVLNLRRNHLTIITRNMFAGLEMLSNLDMTDNRLQMIHERGLFHVRGLHVALFANNQLTFENDTDVSSSKLSPFEKLRFLSELYLSRNNISRIFPDWMKIPMSKLDLRYNQVREIVMQDLLSVQYPLELDLRDNVITYIPPFPQFTSLTEDESHLQVTLDLDGNPLNCGCEVHALLHYLAAETGPTGPIYAIGTDVANRITNRFVLKVDELRCSEPPTLANVTVKMIREDAFTCPLANIAGPNNSCPELCECRFRPHDQVLLVDCSHRGLTEAPIGMENPENYAIEVDLSGNKLTTFPQFDATNVTVMKLSDNYISNIPKEAFRSLAAGTMLKVLELHANNLSQLSQEVLEFLRNSTSLTLLTLHRNPWVCDCRARELLNFVLRTELLTLESKQGIVCVNENRPLMGLTVAELCSVPKSLLISVSLAVASLGLGVGILAALYYRYQWKLKIWLYAHNYCLWFVTEAELDKHKLYDAFISYSHKDEDFVVRELVPELETGPRAYKLCLHYRDWIAGDWIPTQIVRSVEESRRTVIVLSPNFLESVWGRLEFRAAHNRALKEGRARVIVLLYGEIGPTDQLDPELKAYLSMNTYVKWGEPWFWDKLRYALPHASDLTIRTNRGVQRSLAY